MIDQINYDDDLYFIISRLQILQKGMQLKLDEGLLKQYYLGDLKEIAKTLNFFQENLATKNNLINISEYLYSLGRATRLLQSIIEDIIQQASDFSKGFKNDIDDLRKILNDQSNSSEKAENMLRESNFNNNIDANVLSEDEMNLLFNDDHIN